MLKYLLFGVCILPFSLYLYFSKSLFHRSCSLIKKASHGLHFKNHRTLQLPSLRGVEPPLTCLRRASLYPLSYRDKHYLSILLYPMQKNNHFSNLKINRSLQPDNPLKSPSYLRLTQKVFLINAYIKVEIITFQR